MTMMMMMMMMMMNGMAITMILVPFEAGTVSLYGAYNSEGSPSIHAWRYSSFWALACLKKRLHSSVSRTHSSILEFPESALHPYGKRAPILFLVFY